MNRRGFLHAGLAMTPLAAALSALGGCGRKGDWPDGMEPIVWDRDTCVRCRMVISDRRFAAEIRGGPKNTALKFDDVGCAVFWLRDKAGELPWLTLPETRFWVADAGGQGKDARWLEARTAHYVGKTSPMGYNFGAVAHPQGGALDFAAMRDHVIAKGK